MKGYNLPDNVSPNDPEAPWNEEEQKDPEGRNICFECGSTEVVYHNKSGWGFCADHAEEAREEDKETS
jgi:hypothetical protein